MEKGIAYSVLQLRQEFLALCRASFYRLATAPRDVIDQAQKDVVDN